MNTYRTSSNPHAFPPGTPFAEVMAKLKQQEALVVSAEEIIAELRERLGQGK